VDNDSGEVGRGELKIEVESGELKMEMYVLEIESNAMT
jgi:hypothetical protein